MLESGASNFPEHSRELIDFTRNTLSLNSTVRKFKNNVINEYSNIEKCLNTKCYSCNNVGMMTIV